MRKIVKSLLAVSILSLLAACGGAASAPTATSPAPTEAAVPTSPPAAVPDFTQYGFPTVLISQDLTPGQATRITTEVTGQTDKIFTVEVPADAFTDPVTFEILTGQLSNFEANAPAGQHPIMAFAFKVTDKATGELIAKFNAPVMLTAKDPMITLGSKYYNIAPDGTYTDNPTGLQVQPGELSHPVAGAPVGWVITAPTM
jgi:predicted small lipoprotein YifL